MSFLAGRLAATEGAYFRQESKQAVNRLVQKSPPGGLKPSPSSSSSDEGQADVLPEVLRHSLPPKWIKIEPSPPPSQSSLSEASKWILSSHQPNNTNSFVSSSDARNPLRAYVSLPQVTMGPKRWQLPDGEYSHSASTANSTRPHKSSHYNPAKVKAAAEGLSQIGKAFFVASTIVFGGAVVAFGATASKLDLHTSEDIKNKGRELVHAKFENTREQLAPLRIWAEKKSKKWHLEREENVKDNPLVKELSKRLGSTTSN